MDVNAAQFSKARVPRLSSRLDSVTDLRFTQLWNASEPIVVTVSGITTSFSVLFPLKVPDPIAKTLTPPTSSGISTTLLFPVYFVMVPVLASSSNPSAASLASTSSTVSSVVSSTVSSVSAGSASSVGASVSSVSAGSSVSSGTSVASSVSSVVASVSSVCSSGSSWTTVSSVLWSSTASAAAGSTNWAVSIRARSRLSVRLLMFF